MYGTAFRPQHSITLAAVTTNRNIKASSFKSSENIQTKESGPDCTISNIKFSSEMVFSGSTLLSQTLTTCYEKNNQVT